MAQVFEYSAQLLRENILPILENMNIFIKVRVPDYCAFASAAP